MNHDMGSLVLELAKQNLRIDERKNFFGYRSIKIEYNVSKNAEGSARIKLGDTEVIVGVKLDVDKPYPDSEDKGILITNAEFAPIASGEFEPGPPKEDAIELARVVDRGIRESRCIDMEKLCIKKGEKVWIVFIDIYILNHDGNLIDAAALGAIAALNSAFLPRYDKKKEAVVYGELTKTKLPLTCQPITCTFGIMDGLILPDPCLIEEKSIDSRITITTTDEEIHSMQKGEFGGVSVEQVEECIENAFKLSKNIRKLLK